MTSQLQNAMQTGTHDFTIPVNETQPAQTSDAYLTSLGITTVLGTGTSDFSGSAPGRVQNVKTATNLINGLLIPPRKIWSYNKGIGEINADKDFVPAWSDRERHPGTAVGGGVCRFPRPCSAPPSSRACPSRNGGRTPFREIYYEQGGWSPGYDASIQQPDDNWLGGTDFQFVNSTDSWMLIRATISNASVLTVTVSGRNWVDREI